MPDFMTRFIHIEDDEPIEEYFYHTLEDAQAHMNLFRGDDCGLYKRIEVVRYSTDAVLDCLTF